LPKSKVSFNNLAASGICSALTILAIRKSILAKSSMLIVGAMASMPTGLSVALAFLSLTTGVGVAPVALSLL
jgi:hypothetical protein